MGNVTIHLYLPEEAVDTWFPVRAEYLGDDRYRILEEPESDPVLEFHKGDVVRCRLRKLGRGIAFQDELVAYELA